MDSLGPVCYRFPSIGGFQVDWGSFPEPQVLLVGLGEGEFCPGMVREFAVVLCLSLGSFHMSLWSYGDAITGTRNSTLSISAEVTSELARVVSGRRRARPRKGKERQSGH